MGSVGLIHCPGVNLLIYTDLRFTAASSSEGKERAGKTQQEKWRTWRVPHAENAVNITTCITQSGYVICGGFLKYPKSSKLWMTVWVLTLMVTWGTPIMGNLCVYIHYIYTVYFYTHTHRYIQTQLVGGFNDSSPMMVPRSWLSKTCRSGSTSNHDFFTSQMSRSLTVEPPHSFLLSQQPKCSAAKHLGGILEYLWQHFCQQTIGSVWSRTVSNTNFQWFHTTTPSTHSKPKHTQIYIFV